MKHENEILESYPFRQIYTIFLSHACLTNIAYDYVVCSFACIVLGFSINSTLVWKTHAFPSSRPSFIERVTCM